MKKSLAALTQFSFLSLFTLLTAACALQAAVNDTIAPTADPDPVEPATVNEHGEASAPDPVSESSAEPLAEPLAETPPDPDPTPLPPLGYTYQQPDGNRFVSGSAELPTTTPLDIALAERPDWVTAVAISDTATLWGIVLRGQFTQAFIVDGQQVTPVNITPPVLSNVAPLLSMINGEALFHVGATNDPGGNHPVRLNAAGDHAYSESNGRLFIVDIHNQLIADFDLILMPDNRMLVDEQGRLLLLTDPTEAYDHGVLGNGIEAGSITLLNPASEPPLQQTITLPEGKVVEGIAPIWADMNGDGTREIIVTLSDASNGAQIVMFNEAGEQIAAGPAIGQGYRWRHQIAVAPFGPNGETELVDVLTPHLGGVVTFYQWHGERLDIVATVPGYTSHVLGSNNLDMAAAGDFDGDGRIELLLPSQDRMSLGGIQRTADGADVVWTLPLPAQLTSNIAAATMPNGQTVVGVGLDNKILRIWQPTATNP